MHIYLVLTKIDDHICSAKYDIYIVVGDLNSRLERLEKHTADVDDPISKPGQ